MKKNKNYKTYRYQPEIATSIIYWSLTFGCFFVSLISVLEQFTVSLFCLAFFILFLALALLGLTRHLKIVADKLKVSPILKRNRFEIKLAEIKKISVGTYGLTFFGAPFDDRPVEEKSFLMLPKTKDALVAAIEGEPSFKGEIVSIKKSVGH